MVEDKTVCKEPLRFEKYGVKYTIVDPNDVCHPLVKLVDERMGRVVLTAEEYEELTSSEIEAVIVEVQRLKEGEEEVTLDLQQGINLADKIVKRVEKAGKEKANTSAPALPVTEKNTATKPETKANLRQEPEQTDDEIDKEIGRAKRKKEELNKKLEAETERSERSRRMMQGLSDSHPQKDATVQFDEEELDEFGDLEDEDEDF